MCKANRITCGCYCCRFRAELKLEKNMRRKESWKNQRQEKKMNFAKGAPRKFCEAPRKYLCFEARRASPMPRRGLGVKSPKLLFKRPSFQEKNNFGKSEIRRAI